MATVHSMSVITNSCVKPPINPRTGLSSTLQERSVPRMNYTWHAGDDDLGSDAENQEQKPMSQTVTSENGIANPHMQSTEADDFSTDEFYRKLQALKNEHKKTLQLCESLYNEKLSEVGRPETRLSTERTDFTAFGTDYSLDFEQPVHTPAETFNQSLDSLRKSMIQDKVKDLSSKPPIGKSTVFQGRPASAHASVNRSRIGEFAPADRTTESDYWKVTSGLYSSDEFDYSGDEREGKCEGYESLDDTRHTARGRIDDMWDNFSVDDYAPRTRVRSNSLSRLSSSSELKKEEKRKEWQHKITIPKPFQMTLRESSKPKKKTKAMQEVEKRRELRDVEDEQECEKKFKATPVPAHVYMPLFDQIMEEKETRRRQNKEYSEMVLKSMQKPFKFMKREEEKKKQRSSTTAPKVQIEQVKKPKFHFKANPYPEEIFDDTVMDRIREEEEYRRIRMQMRAEELLRTASLPPNMKARGKDYTEGKSRQKLYAERAKKAGLTVEHKFKPRVNDTIPDFEELHRNFYKEMAHRKMDREATVCKPFHLRTQQIPSKKHKVYEDIVKDEETLKENRWPFKNPRARPASSRSLALSRSLSSSMDSIPARVTSAAELRKSATKAKLEQQYKKEMQKLEEMKRKLAKERKLRKVVAERAAANDQSLSLQDSYKEKLRNYREAERARKEEYERELDEIRERVDSRPLLFERTSQANAKRAAEKRYHETLRNAGLDEDFIQRKGRSASGGGSADVGDDYSDDGDSYTRSYTQSSGKKGMAGQSDEDGTDIE